MFDPTIYENMKVVLEGVIYDLDLNEEILIIDRKDLIDLALMSRKYHCTFKTKKQETPVSATVTLIANTEDLAGEILEQHGKNNGCHLVISFTIPIKDENDDPKQIYHILKDAWQSRPLITQQISYNWNNHQKQNLTSTCNLQFNRKLNEDHLEDFPSILKLTIQTLNSLEC
ncbi:hypothetical protein ACJ2A9_18955 [Anaerobacillus sp. MEB173]|uniref:hypothetical protein n=1 Tax=Anaerobacillus sp. MEB173 TaxID=3383345 RepID=UPI003F919A9F